MCFQFDYQSWVNSSIKGSAPSSEASLATFKSLAATSFSPITVVSTSRILFELQKQNAEKQALEDTKSDIGWGSQIRSYVLDDSRIKDLRTGVETRNTQSVLDGDLDKFIEASLKAGL